tara:strand:+ start:859 stop:1758 length:900 start_codon:yes stop_codon:yes gene_type:complete
MPGHTKKKKALPKKYGKMPIKKTKRTMGDVIISTSTKEEDRQKNPRQFGRDKGNSPGTNIITTELVQAGRSRAAEARYKKASKLENRKQRGNEMIAEDLRAQRRGAGRLKEKTYVKQKGTNPGQKGRMIGSKIAGTITRGGFTQFHPDGRVMEGSVNRKQGDGEEYVKKQGPMSPKIKAQKLDIKAPKKPKRDITKAKGIIETEAKPTAQKIKPKDPKRPLTKHSKPALFAMKPKMDGMPKFSYAAMEAKKAGKKSFEYAGKTFPVKKGTYGSANKALYKAKMPAMYKLGVKGLNALDK